MLINGVMWHLMQIRLDEDKWKWGWVIYWSRFYFTYVTVYIMSHGEYVVMLFKILNDVTTYMLLDTTK